MSCPICSRAAEPRYSPFCSRRCADVDLGRWLSGGYAVPAEDETDEVETSAESPLDIEDGPRLERASPQRRRR